MADLRTQYLGLTLGNPFIVSSSSLTDSAEKVAACAAAGAGAVVLKSLFEEEIQAEIDADIANAEHTEALDYLREVHTGMGLKRYRDLIRDAVAAVDIPVIASINAVTRDWWEDHVVTLVEAGAHAIELNISLMPYDYHDDEAAISEFYVQTVQRVKRLVSVPIAVKIGPYFSSIPALIDRLRWSGASAVVLFNRFYQLDIDTERSRCGVGRPLAPPGPRLAVAVDRDDIRQNGGSIGRLRRRTHRFRRGKGPPGRRAGGAGVLGPL